MSFKFCAVPDHCWSHGSADDLRGHTEISNEMNTKGGMVCGVISGMS